MKKIFLFLFFIKVTVCLAQPQWKFHIAFEDATGAKDTIWLIWDTTATGGVPGSGYDTLLGEGPFNFDYSVFNIWTDNENGDSTKTIAFPYNAISFLQAVRAFNYQFPITIRWDSSLFNAPYLPMPVNEAVIDNDYFFAVNNNFPYHYYDMLINNNVIAPDFFWGSQSQFPMNFYIAKDPFIGINEIVNSYYLIYPNPVSEISTIEWNNDNFKEIQIIDSEGKIIKSETVKNKTNFKIKTHEFTKGIYLVRLISEEGNFISQKIIIQ